MRHAIPVLFLLACQSPETEPAPEQHSDASPEVELDTGPEPWQPEDGALGVPTRVLASGWTDDVRQGDGTHGRAVSSPEALEAALQEGSIATADNLWSQIDPTRETIVVLWDDREEHTTDDIWLVAVWQLGALVDVQWRIPAKGEPGGGRPWMVLAVQSPGVTQVLAELDYQPVD